MNSTSSTCTAFAGTRQIASGYLRDVVYKIRMLDIKYDLAPVLIFDDATSKVVEMDLRGTPQYLLNRIAEIESASPRESEPVLPAGGSRGPGRPKLGVVAREPYSRGTGTGWRVNPVEPLLRCASWWKRQDERTSLKIAYG